MAPVKRDSIIMTTSFTHSSLQNFNSCTVDDVLKHTNNLPIWCYKIHKSSYRQILGVIKKDRFVTRAPCGADWWWWLLCSSANFLSGSASNPTQTSMNFSKPITLQLNSVIIGYLYVYFNFFNKIKRIKIWPFCGHFIMFMKRVRNSCA